MASQKNQKEELQPERTLWLMNQEVRQEFLQGFQRNLEIDELVDQLEV